MSVTVCNGKHVEGYSINGSSSAEAEEAHRVACHETTYVGAVLRLRERNGYDDSDFLADVWDAEEGKVRAVQYATTRGWTYHNGAGIDASHEVIALAVAWETGVRFDGAVEKHLKTARKGYTARAVEKGVVVEGVIAWIGEARQYSQWAAKYAEPVARYGIKVEGRKGLVFANADDEGFAFDAEPVGEADMVEWRANIERNVRAEFSQALALADQREPRTAPVAPGTVVDSLEADGDGWRLYAVGESFCEDAWAVDVAVAVVAPGEVDYVITGQRADGSAMSLREGTAFRARGVVARWAEDDETRIMHDGAGAVRMVRDTGAWVELRPVRPEEAAEGPQEGAGAVGAAEVCTHPSQCVTAPVGAVRMTKTATGESGMVGVFCSPHLSHPAGMFAEGYTFEYLTVDGRGPQEGPEAAPVAVETRERPEAVSEAVAAVAGLRYPAVSTSLVGNRGQIVGADSVATVNRWLAGGFLHKHSEQQVPTHHGVCDCVAQEAVAAREAQRELRAEYRARLAALRGVVPLGG